MLDDMRVNDVQLDASDIRQIENADEVAHFFAHLHYDVDVRTSIPLDTPMYTSSQDIKVQINHHELIATDREDEDIRVYLFEVRSVTAKLRNDLARGFLKTTDQKVLLVLTADYENIEFVYLERSRQKSRRKGLTLKSTIRPIPLTVNRLNPDPVALRVLKRFTFTEEDSDYQWEKMRSAYMLAEWSEEYFNNRALFSDYYLTQRLTDEKITPEWREDVRPIGREVFKHLTSARKNYTRQTEDVIRRGLYEPLFEQLGFAYAEQKASASAAEEPDYLLYAPDDTEQPIAAALTYAWNRNLDDVDTTRDTETPDEIPGALVVSLLEAQVAPWVIVTNGKLWRLYSSTASNKATNYYEIDLEEAIAANDQITALKYWWLMFRQEAFTGFLDDLLKKSADYAKDLGDRLKDRVFVEIFPQFAKGFIADMRAQGVTELDLDTVFSGTMTFLYRLMFILYAESLELLPVNEANGYRQLSLYRLKDEIARAGGDVEDTAPEALAAHYSTTSTDLYTRLKELFHVIDDGSDQMNMPTYNGGLFSQESSIGAFLEAYAIPDRYLAIGLDRLTRDIDQKTQALVFIDFKSLGVRQLGSIYEGLLEFKLKIAAEKLAVKKTKGKEVYEPAKKVKKPLAVLEKGDVYLENDKQERKATGSYYTPDYIVKYIVRHTVGPVLDRQFETVTPRLRNAQKGYRDYAKLVEARRKSSGKDESPTVYWNNPEMQQLVDDCLNVRVLDPAMGSGHFLVEVVDYISNRLIDFLNGWSENPVWHFIDQTRQDILDDMERQGVSIDPDRLTRVALLKRAVLKRCVYGVDLNLMAVELAKVSLWLDAFTLGAPLSFLDHHLKHGNSLIGAMDLSDVVAVGSKRWEMILDAASDMVSLSKRTDSTVKQVDASKADYETARAKLEDVKKYANVPIASYFVDKLIEYRKSKKSNVIPQIAQIAYGTKQTDGLQELFDRAQTTADEKHFFHWKLEFPEVFIDLRQRDWNKDGGFDAVVGNPPYAAVSGDEMRSYFDDNFTSQEYQYDLFVFFMDNGLRLLTSKGLSSKIVPSTFAVQHYYAKLRKYLLDNSTVRTLLHFKYPVFEDATVESAVYVISNEPSIADHNIRLAFVWSEEEVKRGLIQYGEAKQELFNSMPGHDLNAFVAGERAGIFSGLLSDANHRFGEIAEITVGIKPYQTGKGKPKQTKQVVKNRDFDAEFQKDKTYRRYLVGTDIHRFDLVPAERWISYGDWLAEPRYSAPFDHPEKILIRQTGDSIIASLDASQHLTLNNLHNIAIKDKSYSLRYILCLLNSNLINFFHQTNVPEAGRTFAEVKTVDLDVLPIRRIDFTTPANERERLVREITGAYNLGDIAGALSRVRAALAAGQTDVIHDVLAHLAQTMIDLNKRKQAEVGRFLGWLEGRLGTPHPKSLSHKGRGTSKRDDENSPLPSEASGRGAGGEGQSGKLIDTFTGKTIIQGYLGDYQKGEGELAWDDFYYRLYQNRNRYAATLSEVEGEIQREYEASLGTLRPIKDQLARTDALIDKIVYRLYGLTDEEIELIERPGYEQALTDAKAQVVGDKQMQKKDDEEKLQKIAEGILPAAKRFFERVTPADVEAALDGELPNWRNLPPDAPVFLLTGDYNLRSLPDHMDFSSSVIPYTKAVEVVLDRLVFQPFRASRYTDKDCHNKFLQAFMRGEKNLTLGSYMIILSSSKETALRSTMQYTIRDVDGFVAVLTDEAMRDVRNKAAHDEVLSRDEARQARAWAVGILGMV